VLFQLVPGALRIDILRGRELLADPITCSFARLDVFAVLSLESSFQIPAD